MKPTLRIIRPSSREEPNLLPPRLKSLQDAGFEVLYEDVRPDPKWTYTAGSSKDRTVAVVSALTETTSDIVLCARGGYGASDLLDLLPWSTLATAPPKLVVGFSDISALHCALYAKLGWPGLHAPMPATGLWGKDSQMGDIDSLLNTLKEWTQGKTAGAIAVTPVKAGAASMAGPLFGGCFTVLTSLIGTPYFPESLAGHIVFIEDTDEHPGRLMRAFNQWIQAGKLQGVQALVIGHLRHLGGAIPDNAEFVLKQFAERSPVPVYHAPIFGHTSPNYPLMIGAQGSLENGRLEWQLKRTTSVIQRKQGAST